MTPQEMLETLLSPHYDGGDGTLANDFISELGRTIPLENLKLLILSDNPATRGDGAFLSTFMGRRRNLNFMIDTLALLLDDPCERVRADAIENITDCAEHKDAEILGRVLLLLDDESDLVRYVMIKFIQCGPPWMIRLAIKHADILQPASAFTVIAELSGSLNAVPAMAIRNMLRHPFAVVRRFGLGLAGKPRRIVFYRFLEEAEQSTDAETSRMATMLLKSPPWQCEWHPSMPSRKVPRSAVKAGRR
jgi:hypothetical protein